MITDPAKLAQHLHDAACPCGDQTAGTNSYWLTIATAALAALQPAAQPHRDGTYPCCPHCHEDPWFHTMGRHDHHSVPCDLCRGTA